MFKLNFMKNNLFVNVYHCKFFSGGVKLQQRIYKFLIFLLFPCFAFAQGALVDEHFFSKSLNADREVFVYLPEGYDAQDTATRYPAIYFLHGASVGLSLYAFFAPSILNDMISTGTIQPAIFILPDGDAPPYEGSFYTNSALYGNFEDYIANDVIEFVDTNFNTIAESGKRFISGHSMGGYGAMKIALKHPDLFAGVAALSGPLDLTLASEIIPDILAENGGAPPYSYSPNAGTFSSLAFTMAGAFSPNLNNGPTFVDFPLDSNGDLIEAVFARWMAHNPATLVKNVTGTPPFDIYFDCGRQDELKVFPFNTAFADTLARLGINYTFRPFDGGHSDKIFVRVRLALVHIDSLISETTVAVRSPRVNIPEQVTLFPNYPNPFNPSTWISFTLTGKSKVKLKIYNNLGQEVAVLTEKTFSQGTHRILWNAGNRPAGVYYARLTADSFVQTQKLVLVK